MKGPLGGATIDAHSAACIGRCSAVCDAALSPHENEPWTSGLCTGPQANMTTTFSEKSIPKINLTVFIYRTVS